MTSDLMTHIPSVIQNFDRFLGLLNFFIFQKAYKKVSYCEHEKHRKKKQQKVHNVERFIWMSLTKLIHNSISIYQKATHVKCKTTKSIANEFNVHSYLHSFAYQKIMKNCKKRKLNYFVTYLICKSPTLTVSLTHFFIARLAT